MQCVSNLRQLAVIATSVASETGFYPPMLSQTTNSGGGLEHTGNFNPSPTSGGDKAATFASPLTLPGGGVYSLFPFPDRLFRVFSSLSKKQIPNSPTRWVVAFGLPGK